MGTAVFECCDYAVCSKEDYWLIEQSARERSVPEFPGESCDIPVVERKHKGEYIAAVAGQGWSSRTLEVEKNY